MKRLVCLVAICLVMPLVGRAQEAANPLTATVRKVFDDYSKDLVGAAEAMPEDKYSFRPTPEVRTFGATVAHIADVNNMVCAKLFTPPATPPAKISASDPKDKLVESLKTSMDYCGQAFSKLTDANLPEMIPFFGGRQATRLGVALAVTNDLVDHYAGLALYLRMNSLLPPTAQKKM
jgi:DinB superfamily